MTTLPDESRGSCARARRPGGRRRPRIGRAPYFVCSGGRASGFARAAANGEAAAFAFGLSRLGFFGSRPLRFCPLAIPVLPKRGRSGGIGTPLDRHGRSPTVAAPGPPRAPSILLPSWAQQVPGATGVVIRRTRA